MAPIRVYSHKVIRTVDVKISVTPQLFMTFFAIYIFSLYRTKLNVL